MLTRLRVVDGKQFVYLQKNSAELCRFLTGKSAYTRPLAASTAFEEVLAARDKTYKASLRELMEGAAEAPAAADEQPPAVDDLGLDEPLVAAAGAPGHDRKLGKRQRASALKQLPRMAAVLVQRPGRPDWAPAVLMDNGRSAPAIEASASAGFMAPWWWVLMATSITSSTA